MMKAYVRVTMDGKTPKLELMCDGYKVCDLSYHDALELALNAASALRFFVAGDGAPKK